MLNKLAEKLAKDQNGADIPDPALFVKNLGLGEGSALPVGVPIPWPSATPPKGWLKCNGAAFTASQYPQLALAYPVMRLPDLRGEFLRGWDDGRGVDTGRALLSSQSHAFTDHRHALSLWTGSALSKSDTAAQKYSPQASRGDGGSMDESVNTGGALGFSNLTNEVASSYKTYASNETRPRNIAFNYIVRAA
nr:phage tail protein [Enterobacter hormaechei]